MNVLANALRLSRQFPRKLSRHWSRQACRHAVAKLLGELERCRTGLTGFGQDSDAEFTILAQGVATLNERLEDVRRQTSALRSTLEDRDEDRALSSAYAIYKNSVDLVHSSVGIAVSEQQQMSSVEAALRRVCATREIFRRNSLMFRMLAMGVRMEAARLETDNQGTFLNVSGAINDIERQMAETTEAAFERIEQVVAQTMTERLQLGELQATLHERAQHSIRTIQAELTRVQNALVPCATEAHAIDELLTTTHPSTARLITALQYQDIVRQKLEHVAFGLTDLTDQAALGGRLELGFVHHAAQIQVTQMAAARKELDRAASEITDGMAGLLAITEQLVQRFETMRTAAGTAFNDCRVAELFKEEIGKLSDIAQQSEQTNQKISHLVARIEEIVQVFAGDIGKHEFDVKLVSLNAQIAAARLPSADALNKLAEEAIHVSLGNAEVTQALARELEQTLTQLGQIKREAGEFLRVVTTEKAALETGALSVGEKLRRLTEAARQNTAEVDREFAAIHQHIAGLLRDLRFPAHIEICCGPAQAVCVQLVAETTDIGADALDADAHARLARHRDRYTMQTERESHARSLATIQSQPLTPEARPTLTLPVEAAANGHASDSHDLGDGIELF